jgi:SET domain-containing protein
VSSAHAPGITVRRGRRGRGVFATRRFREGDVIETCPAIAVPDEDVDGLLRDYVFSSQRGKVLLVLGYGMLYNHSGDPNVFTRSAGRLMVDIVALRDIEVGEELTHDYGPEYWDDRNRVPR